MIKYDIIKSRKILAGNDVRAVVRMVLCVNRGIYMKLEYLQYFISVADCLNFTKAAKKNHIAQTAISRHIASLENELGVQLFERNNRYVKLTPEGVQFYLDISSVLRKYDQAVKNVQSIRNGFYGHINIGIGVYEDSFVSMLLKDFHMQYPNFKATLGQYSYLQLCEMVVKGDLDIAFMNTFFCENAIKNLPDSVKLYDLFQVDVCAIVHKNDTLLQKSFITKNDINNHSILLYNDANRTSVTRLAKLNVHPRNTIQFNSFSGLLSMIKANYGIGFVPSFIKENLPSDVMLVPQTIFPTGKCFALVSYVHHNPANDYFMNIVRVSEQLWKKLNTTSMDYH